MSDDDKQGIAWLVIIIALLGGLIYCSIQSTENGYLRDDKIAECARSGGILVDYRDTEICVKMIYSHAKKETP